MTVYAIATEPVSSLNLADFISEDFKLRLVLVTLVIDTADLSTPTAFAMPVVKAVVNAGDVA